MLRVMQRSPTSPEAPAPLYHCGRIALDEPNSMSVDPNHFPTRLHEMLREITDSGDWTKYIAWQSHGKCFIIKNKEEFSSKVLSKWFCRLKFTTFERQLHKHGFRKLSRKGPDQGAYYHPKFLRDMPEMARTITHTNTKGKRGRKPKSKLSEPDFYSPDSKLSTASALEQAERPGQVGLGLEDLLQPRSSMGAPSATLRQEHNHPDMPEAPTFPGSIRAAGGRPSMSSSFDIQGRSSHHQALRNESKMADEFQQLSRSHHQSLVGASVLQHDALTTSSRPFQSQLSGYLDSLSGRGSSLRVAQHASAAAGLDSDEHVTAPLLGRQSSDYSMGSGLLLGLGSSDSNLNAAPDHHDVSTFAQLEAYSAAAANAQASASSVQSSHGLGPQSANQVGSSMQPPVNDHQQRINDLIFRNQQQQRNLQLQQQQLEQQRLELQLQQQQRQDVSVAGLMPLGQSLGGSAFQQQVSPLASTNFLLREQQQQLQQYQNQLNQSSMSSLGFSTQQQQNHGQGDSQSPSQYNPYQGF